jgi:hypothetical protein
MKFLERPIGHFFQSLTKESIKTIRQIRRDIESISTGIKVWIVVDILFKISLIIILLKFVS